MCTECTHNERDRIGWAYPFGALQLCVEDGKLVVHISRLCALSQRNKYTVWSQYMSEISSGAAWEGVGARNGSASSPPLILEKED
jgi:hypothetical protein